MQQVDAFANHYKTRNHNEIEFHVDLFFHLIFCCLALGEGIISITDQCENLWSIRDLQSGALPPTWNGIYSKKYCQT